MLDRNPIVDSNNLSECIGSCLSKRSELERSLIDRFQAKHIVQERIDLHNILSKPKIHRHFHYQLLMANRGVRNGYHDSGNIALYKYMKVTILHFLFHRNKWHNKLFSSWSVFVNKWHKTDWWIFLLPFQRNIWNIKGN